MGKRTTKADMILAAAEERMNEAERVRDACRVELGTKQSIYEVHAELYGQLRCDSAPKPRKASTKAIPRCTVCGYAKESIVHGPSYDGGDAHHFEHPSKPRSNGSATGAKSKRVSKAAADTKCSKCGETADGALHGTGYIDSHPFAPSSDAPSAKRKSSSASASKKDGDQSILVNDGSVSTASSVEGNPNEVS